MSRFPELTPARRQALLVPPADSVDMVLDTDTYNEIDDQFALVYAILSEELNLQAVYAAPFFNSRSDGPEDGMKKSYDEIVRILELLDIAPQGLAWRGSPAYLPNQRTAVESAAVRDLVEKAQERDEDDPLYVVAIGAITNVASALLTAPEIIEKIVVIWLGGHPIHWPHTKEFNLRQDLAAASVVFDSGVPLVRLPCANVTEQLRTTVPEMERYVKGQGEIGDYLFGIFCDYSQDHFAWSKVIWDISCIAYLVNADWITSDLTPSPLLNDDVTWGEIDHTRHLIRTARHVDRDAVFGDLFSKLAR